jgi:uncharacterized protein YceK
MEHRASKAKRPYQYHLGGLRDEERILEHLRSLGHDVTPSEALEDITQDIDMYLDGISTSIKAQHSGLKYGNIYLELTTQHWSSTPWCQPWLTYLASLDMPKGWSPEGWYPSWGLTGQAQQYLILQGQKATLYNKGTLNAWVEQKGFIRIRGLSAKTLETQGGRDTICGFIELPVPSIKYWRLPV